MRFTEAAPAKINLFLHVGPTGADGYHPLASLMVFADLADELARLQLVPSQPTRLLSPLRPPTMRALPLTRMAAHATQPKMMGWLELFSPMVQVPPT